VLRLDPDLGGPRHLRVILLQKQDVEPVGVGPLPLAYRQKAPSPSSLQTHDPPVNNQGGRTTGDDLDSVFGGALPPVDDDLNFPYHYHTTTLYSKS